MVAAAVAVATLVAACGGSGGPAPEPTAAPERSPVVVASFNFTESSLLAEIYAQALAAAGVPVRRELDLGPRELVRPALQRQLVDVVPEYLGTAFAALDSEADIERRSPGELLAGLRRALAPWHLDALTPAAAQDQNGFAVTAATARRYGLRALSDLVPVAHRLVLGGATECPRRPLCLPGLRRVYGLAFRGFRAFDDERQRAIALEQGVVDVEVTFTTDPRLADGSLVLLRDDKRLQPAESVVPVVTAAALQRYGPRLRATLDAVSARLDSPALTFLNWRVQVAGKGLRAEARGWLQRHGLLG